MAASLLKADDARADELRPLLHMPVVGAAHSARLLARSPSRRAGCGGELVATQAEGLAG